MTRSVEGFLPGEVGRTETSLPELGFLGCATLGSSTHFASWVLGGDVFLNKGPGALQLLLISARRRGAAPGAQ